MIHTIFWLYILSLVMSSISIFLSFMLVKRVGTGWYRAFIYILICDSLYMFLYTVFYFIYKYGDGITPLLELLMFSSEWVLAFVSTFLLLSLTEGVLEKRLGRGVKWLLLSLQSVSIVLFITVFFNQLDLYVIISFLFLILYAFILFFNILKNWKMMLEKGEKLIIFYLIGLSVITLPLEVLEYYIFKAFIPADTYFPIGIVTASLFSVLISFFNIKHSIKYFYHSLHPPEESCKENGIESGDYSDCNDYDDVPTDFIEAFAITNRESEIVEYIVKGYNHQDIAEYLKISRRTVETHSYNVYKKCEISNRVELMNLLREYQ